MSGFHFSYFWLMVTVQIYSGAWSCHFLRCLQLVQCRHPLRLPRTEARPCSRVCGVRGTGCLCKKEDAGGDVSAPGAEQRLPAAPGAVPGVPGHMGGLWLLLGLQHMEEPPLPGTARGHRPRIFIWRVFICVFVVCQLLVLTKFLKFCSEESKWT